MAIYHKHLSQPYYNYIAISLDGYKGIKDIEVRANEKIWQTVKVGDFVEWYNDDDSYKQTVLVRITERKTFDSIEECLCSVGLPRCLPNVELIEEGIEIYCGEHGIYPHLKNVVKENCVVAFVMEIVPNDTEQYKLLIEI